MDHKDRAVYEFLGRLQFVLSHDRLTDAERIAQARADLAILYKTLGWDAEAAKLHQLTAPKR